MTIEKMFIGFILFNVFIK